MDPKTLVIAINTFMGSLIAVLKASLISLGIDPTKVSSTLNLLGLFFAGFLTVVIVTAGIISYIKGTQYEPFYNSYEDDTFITGRAGTVMGVVTIVCAVWFLFSIVYIYFIQ